MFDITELFERKEYSEDKRSYFEGFKVVDAILHKSSGLVILKIENDRLLPYRQFKDLEEYFHELGLDNLRLYFKVKDQEFPIKEINNYLKDFSSSSSRFRLCVPVLEEGGFSLVYPDHDSLQADSEALDDIKLFFYDIGFRGAITTKLHEEKEVKPVEVERRAMPKKETPVEEKKEAPVFNKTQYKPRSRTYTDVVIDDLVDTLYNVKFTGQIFKVEEKVTRTNMIIQTVYVKDKDNAVIVKVVENRRFTKEELAKNKEGKYANFYGNYRFDTFANGYIFEVDQIEFIDVDTSFHDDEEEKRIELHCHTNRSEMDGVCDAEELVQAAFSMGHDAIAITDHLDVQAFPTAQKAANKLMKGTDRLFKIIYGCEMNMVDSRLNLVYNPVPLSLADAEYCVLDFETTGLSTRHDYIIEFGASILYKGIVKQKKDLFVKPPIAVPQKIKELTNITDAHLASAKPFKECYQEIMDFIGDRVIVAHNAAFDFGFLNEEMKRNGLKELTNPVIDTLDLARSLFSNRRSYRLGNIARQYSVSYDEAVAHRADYDAEVLAQVFHLMLKDCYKLGIHDLMELSEYHTEDAFIKNREYHTNVLVKNKQGLKDLFKLVSISNTTQLAVFGKANTKSEDSQFVVEPRIFRETLNEYRENLLLGSACCNGEVFEIASTRNKEALAKAISFYDFIEVQPLENYRHLLERGSFDEERLKQYLRDIIDEAEAQNKIIVATGDVHYARSEQKILRDVYINAQGIGGVHHPLFIYDKERRKRQVSPDQHFRNTREMLDAFAWLKDDALVKDIVVRNTHKIADMIEVMTPIHDKLYTPVIEGSNDKLTQIVYQTAHERYGEVLDPIIEERIKKELDSIIGNGYGVIYYVSYLLVKKSNEDGYLVGSRGSVGSSLVATFSGISECNPLPPHYICPKCKKLIWRHDTKSGYNLPYMNCPDCGEQMIVDGQDIPFETFLGFHGDKVPDIDLNFSDQYQDKAHLFLRSVFGEDYVFRAGTISTVAEKTAFGYVSGYCEEKEITNMSRAQRQRLASGCEGVKRTTGQHPGGIIVIPNYMNVFDFTPYQYPANNPDSVWRTTHFDFHEIHDNVLKFDILGHVDPTAMKLLQDISGIDVKTIPMNDPKVMSIFSSPKELGIVNPKYDEATGACGLPEFGTRFVRGILQETQPKNFSELVQISGLSHGTDVWNNNAKDLVDSGIALADVIGCRDDIMSDMLHYGLEPKDAFDIMENVRKGKVANGKCDKWPDYEQKMLDHNVPKWYIESCKKIKYMFPKAHAVAYVIMAVRVAWFKIYHPEYYYVSFFSLRCDAYEIETMIKDADSIKARLDEIGAKLNSKEDPASKKEKDIYDTLEISYEMASRGYRMSNIDLNRSLAKEFLVNPEDHHEIIPPFKILDGLGDNVAVSIVEARNERPFLSKEDLVARTQISQTLLKKMESLGVLKDLDDSNQISLF